MLKLLVVGIASTLISTVLFLAAVISRNGFDPVDNLATLLYAAHHIEDFPTFIAVAVWPPVIAAGVLFVRWLWK